GGTSAAATSRRGEADHAAAVDLHRNLQILRGPHRNVAAAKLLSRVIVDSPEEIRPDRLARICHELIAPCAKRRRYFELYAEIQHSIEQISVPISVALLDPRLARGF